MTDVYSIFLTSMMFYLVQLFALLFFAWFIILLILVPLRYIFGGLRSYMRKV